MKAILLTEKGHWPTLADWPNPIPTLGQTVVKLQAAALNHRDVWISKGQYAGIVAPCILGSDGAGELADGRRVIINPGIGWHDDTPAQPADYHVLGMPAHGTFAEYVAIDATQIFDIPTHLDFESAAALPLAGLTAWRTLMTRCQLQHGERVLISGVGGGVALFAAQFAIAAGAEVWVTSSSETKIERAISLGALGGISYKTPNWSKKLTTKAGGGFDVVIDSAVGEGFKDIVKCCNPGARIGIYGGTQGAMSGVSPQIIFWKQLSILGSTMGNTAEFRAMLAFVAKHQIQPVIDTVFALSDGTAALKYMESGQQFGKIVLKT